MLIDFTPRGIHLPGLGLWLDPLSDCEMAWVSHGHRDHARGTHGCVLGTPETLEIYKIRYGEELSPATRFEPLQYGQSFELRGARLTAYPAGHILGSAQLLIESNSQRILYTGDIKRLPPLCGALTQVIPCHRLIIESTFGLPIFHFLPREEARARMVRFARECPDQKVTPVFLAHPLGRGQEVLEVLCEAGIPAAVDESIARFIPLYEASGFSFPGWTLHPGAEGARVVAHGFQRVLQASGRSHRIAYVSGWAALDNARARTSAEELIPYSDHAAFEELLAVVRESGAQQIEVVHGYAEAFARLLRQAGWRARAPLAGQAGT